MPREDTQFKKGNPGKPKGAVSQTTLLKEKILSAALSIDLKGNRKAISALGKIIKIPNIRPEELIKVAATFVPKEQTIKGEGFETNITLANILSCEEVAPEVRRELIEALRARRGSEQPLITD